MSAADVAPRVFVSYVHEDGAIVTQVCSELRAHGVEVWQDVERLVGGDFWTERIREQIETCDFFLAFFSAAYIERKRSFMTEEINQAVDQIRQRRGRWFVPIVLSGTLPEWEIGGGKTLHSLHWIDFRARPWATAMENLLLAIGVRPGNDTPPNLPALKEYLERVASKKSWGRRLDLPQQVSPSVLGKALRCCRVPHDAAVLAVIDCYNGVMFWRNGKAAIVFTTKGVHYADEKDSGFISYVQCRSYEFRMRSSRVPAHRPGTYLTLHFVCFPDADVYLAPALFGPSAHWIVAVLNDLRRIV